MKNNAEIKRVTNKLIGVIDDWATLIDCDTCEHYRKLERFNNYPCCACIVKTDIGCHWKEKAKPNFHHSFMEVDDYE